MSPRTEETNQRIRQEQRNKILDAAKSIFAHKGYTDTKMTEIAAAAEVSYGLAYHYFTNKEAMFVAIVEQAFAGTSRLFQAALALPGSPWERLHWLVSQILDGMREQGHVYMVIVQAFTNDTAPREAREIAYKQGYFTFQAMMQLIAEGQAAGQIVQGNPERLTIVFGACLQGLALAPATFDFNLFGKPFEFPEVDDVLQILRP